MLSPQENEFLTRTGPGTPLGELFRRFWLPVMLAEELPTPDCPPVRVKILGEQLVAFRDTNGRIGLLDAFCAHRRAELFFGRNEECGLRCVYHGWKYDVEGNCVDMPSESPSSQFKEMIHLTAYPIQERGGVIWAYLGPKHLEPQFPELEWTRVPDSHRYVAKIHVECNYLQALEGDIDNAHVSNLHSYVDLGVRERMTRYSKSRRSIEVMAKDKSPRGVVKDTDYGLLIGWRRDASEDEYYWSISQWLLPAYAMVAGAEPGASMLCQNRVPIDDENSLLFRVMWNPHRPITEEERYNYRTAGFYPELLPGSFLPTRNKSNDFLIDRELQRTFSFTGIRGQVEQDLAVTVSMGPIVDRSKENLGTSDIAIVAMRRKLRQVATDLLEGIEPYAAHHGEAYRVRTCGLFLKKDVPFDEGAKEWLVAQV